MMIQKTFSPKCTTIELARGTGRGNGFLLEIIKSICGIFLLVCLTGVCSDFACALILGNTIQKPGTTIVILYSELVGIAAGVLYCAVFERRSIRSVGFKLPAIKSYLQGVVSGAILISLVILLSTVLGGLQFAQFGKNISIAQQLLLLGGFAIQGMSEEVLFRGYVFVSMARKNRIVKAALGSSVLFSLLHVFNDGFSVLPFLNLTLFGILEVLVFLKTDDIWAAGALHGIWNYMQGCVFGLNVSGTPICEAFFTFHQTDKAFISGGTFGPEGGIVVTVFLLAAIIGLTVTMCKEIPQETA